MKCYLGLAIQLSSTKPYLEWTPPVFLIDIKYNATNCRHPANKVEEFAKKSNNNVITLSKY